MYSPTVINALAGTTIRGTWVSSGVTPTSISLALIDKDETLVTSLSMISSGNGHYYAPLTVPTSDAWYVMESVAMIDGYPYVNRALVKRWKLGAN